MKHLLLLLPALVVVHACSSEPAETRSTPPTPVHTQSSSPKGSEKFDRTKLAVFQRLPTTFATEAPAKELIDLGRMLYFDKRLSKNHDVSCNTCHDLNNLGVDGKPTSQGHKGQRGVRNSSTVYNAAGQFAQFWDGRAKSVEEQALAPIENPVEMASKRETVLKVLLSIPEYRAAFRSAFKDQKTPVNWENVGTAIGAFERGLATPSPFDKFLGGDDDALSHDAKRGLNLFVDKGCVGCHSGPLVGGNMYMKLGLLKPFSSKDQGRFEVTHNDGDRLMFKVPSLRNVEKTAPYFHDGSVKSLREATKIMADIQLGQQLNDDELAALEAFQRVLTGELPTEYIRAPELPKSTKKKPAPDPT